MEAVKIIECPRDAMQGIKQMIDADDKARYINSLLKVGYDTIDFGSFVSPRAIPQMADTREVLGMLDLDSTNSKLLAIVANQRGARDASQYKQIQYLGYPFSVSETFQQRNANSSIAESLERVKSIQEICTASGQELVIYISMGFGNPYNDPYSPEIVLEWVDKLQALGIMIFSLSDTVGVANPEIITYLFSTLVPAFPELEFGAHLHTAPHNWRVKVEAAYNNGCRRFDSAIMGYGGCPMAKDELIGNMPTENLVNYFDEEALGANFSIDAFENSLRIAREILPL